MPNIERDLIIAILKLTASGPASHKLINKEAKIPEAIGLNLLQMLQEVGLVYAKRGFVEANSFQRSELALRAMRLGADPENVSSLLRWQEFEAIAAVMLERNHYVVSRRLRFKRTGHRHEIDVVACRKPFVVCIDCKHWRHGIHSVVLRHVVDGQVKRTAALAECLRDSTVEIEFSLRDEVQIIPAVLSLTASGIKFFDDVPVIPILQFHSFLSELPAHVASMKHFSLVTCNFKNGLLRERKDGVKT
jgi:Holliday junction resolvase-like predicted endonuclease